MAEEILNSLGEASNLIDLDMTLDMTKIMYNGHISAMDMTSFGMVN